MLEKMVNLHVPTFKYQESVGTSYIVKFCLTSVIVYVQELVKNNFDIE